MNLQIVEGDLLDQQVDAIVNPWNRNLFPWWLLIPQGVSGAIKRRAGVEPFRELARHGGMPLGSAVATGAGRLPFQAIVHVAGINLAWRASRDSICQSVRHAMEIARQRNFRSIAFPLIGSGSGGFSADAGLDLMRDELQKCEYEGRVVIVRYRKQNKSQKRIAEFPDAKNTLDLRDF